MPKKSKKCTKKSSRQKKKKKVRAPLKIFCTFFRPSNLINLAFFQNTLQKVSFSKFYVFFAKYPEIRLAKFKSNLKVFQLLIFKPKNRRYLLMVCCDLLLTSNLVSHSLWLNHSDVVNDSLVYVEVLGEPTDGVVRRI